jgi:hypothetical protein
MLDTLLKYSVGIVGLAFLLGVFTGLLPRQFSFYTLQDFGDSLDSIGGFLTWSLGFFSAWFDVAFFLVVLKIICWSLIAGSTIKLGIFVFNIFSSGGA